MLRALLHQVIRAAKFVAPNPLTYFATWKIRRSGLFDRAFYRTCHPTLNALFRRFPERHYVIFGEAAGLQPNPDFSPTAYRQLNPDLAGVRHPFLHYVRYGKGEHRLIRTDPSAGALRGKRLPPVLRRAANAPDPAPHAIVAHIYYPDLWDEMSATIASAGIAYDLFVTYVDQGDLTADLPARITADFPQARVIAMPNHGRDIFPFVHLINAGLLAPYRAVCKIHTKKSPHRTDGDDWRRHLIAGLLPKGKTQDSLDRFLQDTTAAVWVADGQHYSATKWWGSNQATTEKLLNRIEILMDPDVLSFPAGSMYWLKPVMISMIRGLQLDQDDFELEIAQLDGTIAHAFERALGYMVQAGNMQILQASVLAKKGEPGIATTPVTPPEYVSAFYLPQFHRTPENDAWWGSGYTEWQAATAAKPQFEGHAQPALPTDLGFYDLLRTEVLGEQAALARSAGIDAFCSYFYWFDGKPLLEGPLQNLLSRPDIDFPFYLCWANESWRRNWDGLSGEVLIDQTYHDGFEAALVKATLPYMRDLRYQRPDGTRPRFVIYRPEDLPDPEASVVALRQAWRASGIGDVELGAVRFHVPGAAEIPEDLFDFWIEMPPHGLVDSSDYLVGGPDGNQLNAQTGPGFSGLIYDYSAVIANSLSPDRTRARNTIAGVMPSWDNTARRGRTAHIAYGANPARFAHWLRGLSEHRLAESYRNEVMINAWNEWAEKAMLEPSRQYDRAYLDILGEWKRTSTDRKGRAWHD